MDNGILTASIYGKGVEARGLGTFSACLKLKLSTDALIFTTTLSHTLWSRPRAQISLETQLSCIRGSSDKLQCQTSKSST